MSRSLDFARAAYREIPLYVPDTQANLRFDASDNTNLFGTPPAARRVLSDWAKDPALLARYPIPYGVELKAALAKKLGVPAECVTTGCGSDDILDSAIRAFGEPGESLCHPLPTFGMIPIFAQLNGLRPVGVALKADWDIDADALVATGARITYLCSPNNPTGTMVTRGALQRVLQGARGMVLLDEAYAEFSGVSDLSTAPDHGRLLVTRTFSKAWGLAGLRIGYAVGAPELVREVEKSRGPYTLSAVAEQAALAALREDNEWMQGFVKAALASRVRLEEALVKDGLKPIPSAANFLLVPLPGAREVVERIRLATGIVVRGFTALPGVGDCVRIGVGPWPLMEEVLEALRKART